MGTCICDRKMIQFMPANHSVTNHVITILIFSDKTHFQNVYVTASRCYGRGVIAAFMA